MPQNIRFLRVKRTVDGVEVTFRVYFNQKDIGEQKVEDYLKRVIDGAVVEVIEDKENYTPSNTPSESFVSIILAGSIHSYWVQENSSHTETYGYDDSGSDSGADADPYSDDEWGGASDVFEVGSSLPMGGEPAHGGSGEGYGF